MWGKLRREAISIVTAYGKRPNLLGRDMLHVIKIDWSDYIYKSRIYNVNNTNLLDDILEKHSEVFNSELCKMKGVLLKIPYFLRLNLYFTK